MNDLDKLFEKKLTDHSLLPSARAWENVEAQLSKKNKIVWLPWAAVFLLGGLLLSVLWLRTDNAELPLAEAAHVKPQESAALPALTNEVKPSPTPKKKRINPSPELRHPKTKNDQPQEKMELAEAIVLVPETQSHQAIESIAVVEKPKRIVLTYTLDPVETPGHATEEIVEVDAKDGSFKKMIKFAGDVKNSESPLGGIRDMKEELFAFDLKKKTTTKKH